MFHRRRNAQKTTAAVLLAALLPALSVTTRAYCGESLPAFDQVQKVVLDYFQQLPDYQPGSILTRSDAQGALDRLKQTGWTVADREAILSAMPTADEFLVQQLRTPAGRKFATRIAAFPEGYDRLERLSRLPNGKTTVRDLIRAKGGYELIQYMTTSRGGTELGKMLSQDPHGARFNQPTGRIYTANMFLARLAQSYAAATNRASSRQAAR